ncbi:MAG TPA: hypothetical protein VN841_27845 [Bryobacteraceae bacterium]|nr:hypothetical protein [Bryobacteraceae bacterium]
MNTFPVRAAIVMCWFVGWPVAAQWLSPTAGIPRTADGKPILTAPAPRTPDGKPDLSGFWALNSGKYMGNIASDQPPGVFQPWAEALYKQHAETYGKDDPYLQCLPQGPRMNVYYPLLQKIIQTPGLIAILMEDLTFRQIFMDGRALPQDPNPSYMGYSVGRWDGDTLVVETIGFNDRTWLDLSGHTHSEALRTTERFRRRDLGHMEIQETFDDPQTFTKPWSITIQADLALDIDIIEYICAENEKDAKHLVGKASEAVEDAKKRAVKVAPEVLAKYVGTYESHALENPVTARLTHVTVKDGVLFGESSAAIPLSDTVFFWGGTRHEFVMNEQGVVTHMLEGENGNKAVRISGGN